MYGFTSKMYISKRSFIFVMVCFAICVFTLVGLRFGAASGIFEANPFNKSELTWKLNGTDNKYPEVEVSCIINRALQEIEKESKLRFNNVHNKSEHTDISINFSKLDPALFGTINPNNQGEITINSNRELELDSDRVGFNEKPSMYRILLHEILHSLGLEHIS